MPSLSWEATLYPPPINWRITFSISIKFFPFFLPTFFLCHGCEFYPSYYRAPPFFGSWLWFLPLSSPLLFFLPRNMLICLYFHHLFPKSKLFKEKNVTSFQTLETKIEKQDPHSLCAAQKVEPQGCDPWKQNKQNFWWSLPCLCGYCGIKSTNEGQDSLVMPWNEIWPFLALLDLNDSILGVKSLESHRYTPPLALCSITRGTLSLFSSSISTSFSSSSFIPFSSKIFSLSLDCTPMYVYSG